MHEARLPFRERLLISTSRNQLSGASRRLATQCVAFSSLARLATQRVAFSIAIQQSRIREVELAHQLEAAVGVTGSQIGEQPLGEAP